MQPAIADYPLSTAPLPKRVLVVDDEPELLRTISLRLRKAGYDVLSACDGFTATQIAIQEHPDVILLDIGLPGGDGHSVAKRLFGNHRTMDIPIIFLTARTGRDDVVMAQRHGAFSYLVKPYEASELLEMVKLAAEGAHLRHEHDGSH
ncbi:MAG: response regulator [Vicinamibacterales bacterium]